MSRRLILRTMKTKRAAFGAIELGHLRVIGLYLFKNFSKQAHVRVRNLSKVT